jgi:hypothetical protein
MIDLIFKILVTSVFVFAVITIMSISYVGEKWYTSPVTYAYLTGASFVGMWMYALWFLS